MNKTLRKKREVSQCRSCKQIFNNEDIKVIETERYGLIIKEKVCPHCGSSTYGKIDYLVDEFDLLYNDKFYRNSDKTLRRKLDLVVDETLERDQILRTYINREKQMNEEYLSNL